MELTSTASTRTISRSNTQPSHSAIQERGEC